MDFRRSLRGPQGGFWMDVATGHFVDPFAYQIVKLTNTRLIEPLAAEVPAILEEMVNRLGCRVTGQDAS